MARLRCEVCGKIFFVESYRAKTARFCSLGCYGTSPENVARLRKSSAKRRQGKIVKCTECGRDVYRHPSTINRRRCSKACANKYIARVYKSDKNRTDRLIAIGKTIDHSKPSTRRKLSTSIKRAFVEGRLKPRRGSDSNLWKGGVASLQNTIRHSPKYNEWRTAVYTRDGFRCKKCGTGKDLHAHHIKEFSKFPDLRLVVSNGITLCKKCHSDIHGRNVPTPKRVIKSA